MDNRALVAALKATGITNPAAFYERYGVRLKDLSPGAALTMLTRQPLAELPVPFGIVAEDWEHLANLCDLVHEKQPAASIGSGIGPSAIATARRMHYDVVPNEDLHAFAARFDQWARTRASDHVRGDEVSMAE